MKPKGIRFCRASNSASTSPPARWTGQPRLDHRGVHLARHNGIDANAFGRIFHSRNAGEVNDARLCCRIGHLRRSREPQPRCRRGIHDRTAALSFHVQDDMLAGQEDSFQIDFHLAIPVLFGQGYRTALGRTTNVVH